MAGAAEHCAMFPFDTIKTHAQAEGASVLSNQSSSTLTKIIDITNKDGLFRLWRGVSTMFFACIPAHAAYFSIFESMKTSLGADVADEHFPVQSAIAGVTATLAHDSIMTPMDVAKQRLQLGFYTGLGDCISSIIKTEGISALFLSFPTTLIMNIPYAAIMVASNESWKTILNPSGEYNLGAYLFSGAASGALAAAITNPLDVAKTRLQTQSLLCNGCKVTNSIKSSVVNTVTTNNKIPYSTTSSIVRSLRRHLLQGPLQNPGYNSMTIGLGLRYRTKKLGSQHKSLNLTSLTQHKPMLDSKSCVVGMSEPNNFRHRYTGLVDAMTHIYKEEGLNGFTKGLRARLFVHTPSVAISWTAYESAKGLLVNSGKFD